MSELVPLEIHGWRAKAEDTIYSRQSIFDYMNGAGEIYRLYGFRELFVRRFVKAGQPDIVLELFDMGSPEDAFGVLSHGREGQGEDVAIGGDSEYDRGLLFFCTEAYPDPDTSKWLCSEVPSDEFPDGNNDQHICDQKLDELFALQKTQMDFAERQQTFWEIGEYMLENVYWLGVWQDPDSFGVSDRLTNVSISGVTPFYNIYEWDLK